MYQYLLRVQGQISSARDQSTTQSRRVYYTMCQFGFELKGTTRAKECRCNLIKLGVRLVDHFRYKNVQFFISKLQYASNWTLEDRDETALLRSMTLS